MTLLSNAEPLSFASHDPRPRTFRRWGVTAFCAASAVSLAGLFAGCDDKGAVATNTNGERAIIPDDPSAVPPTIGSSPPGRSRPGATRPGEDPSGSGSQGRAPAEGASTAFASELASLHRVWSAEEASLLAEFPRHLEKAFDKTGPFASLVRAAYTREGAVVGEPIFSRAGQLTTEADSLLETILLVADHGLDPKRYQLEDLNGVVQKLGDFAVGRGTPNMSEDERALWKLLVETRPTSGEPSVELLAEVSREKGFTDADVLRLKMTRAHLDAVLAQRKELNQVLAELDVLLVHGVHRWIFDQRFIKKAHPFLADKSEADALKRTAKEIEVFAGLDWKNPSTAAAALQAAVPRFPDYEPTRQAFLRYRGYAEKYPQHIELPAAADKLAKGKSGDVVKQLEERLIQEEYLAGPATGKFGDALVEALNLYQETHQMKPIGKMDRATRLSLNRTFADRADQLSLSLMRYRESDLHQSGHRFGEIGTASDKNGSPTSQVRARINIPAMEARFYVGTELGKTHRVVVGNNDTETDATTGKRGKLNQTRLFTAEMQTIVLNPVWNVPKRIKEQELDLLLMDEPDYYEKHNFKVILNPDGTERVVQQGGSGNALGLVKFLFPNQFAIYMHDTPKKKLFERPVRAFSHGCMRTENPLDLARWILVEIDKELTDEQFDEVLAAKEERHFAVNPRIAISTDYVTTTIDDQGRINFLADVYGFDKDYFEGKVPHGPDRDFPLTVLF